MLFNSINFLIFFPIVFCFYFIIPSKIKSFWLLAASYYFYMCWDAKYALLILTSTVITYFSGLLLEKLKNSEGLVVKKSLIMKFVIFISLISNLGILFYFKYFNFMFQVLENIFQVIHIQIDFPMFDIVLPVGISFYTFQAIGYTIDVYRNSIHAEKNFIKYALFVSFFPQLVAGPIERSKSLLKQLGEVHKLNFDNMREGFLLMLWGYFLKIVLADRIAIFVDTVYGDFNNYGGTYLFVATMLFAIQIYCDFAGYSTIAMGTAKMLGINLMENFNAPYLATSVSDFWRRWHISLTSWFKDYLYIPIGGSRKGKYRKYINKLIVFLVSGLWHGAKFSFVAWGAINGLFQIIGEILAPIRKCAAKLLGLNSNSVCFKLCSIFNTFVLVDFTWIFFRASRFKDAILIIKNMLTVYNPWVLFDGSLYTCGLNQKNFSLMLLCIGILFFVDICKERGFIIRKIILRQDYLFRWLIIAFSVWAILLFGIWGPGYNEASFIYFQF